jgi:hypothetical protein
LNSNPQVAFVETTCVKPTMPSGAESGAVAAEPSPTPTNPDVLAAFLAVLTPEQRAALAKMLGNG